MTRVKHDCIINKTGANYVEIKKIFAKMKFLHIFMKGESFMKHIIKKSIVFSKTLRCKVTVKDNRKPVTKPNPTPAPSPAPNGECEHVWVVTEKKFVGTKLICNHGLIFNNEYEWTIHCDPLMEQGLDGCGVSFSDVYETYYECSKCHKTKIETTFH